jgi:hypothetical protein
MDVGDGQASSDGSRSSNRSCLQSGHCVDLCVSQMSIVIKENAAVGAIHLKGHKMANDKQNKPLLTNTLCVILVFAEKNPDTISLLVVS